MTKLLENKTLVFSLFLFWGFIIYSNSLNVPFYFDDFDNIKNPALRVQQLDFDEFKGVLQDGTLKSRPISNLSFALNYYFGGYKVQGYHLVNILIHIVTGFALFLFIRKTLEHTVNQYHFQDSSYVAFLASLVWLVHPVATNSVTYIVQRMNSLCAMFFIIAMVCYVYARISAINNCQPRLSYESLALYVGSIIFGVFAIGSKEIAITLPLVIFLYEWFFYQDLSWKWLKKKSYLIGILLLLLFAITYVLTDGQIIKRIFLSYGNRDFTMEERVLTQGRVVIHYISMVLFPHPERIILDYDFAISRSLFQPITTILSYLFIGAVTVWSIIIARKNRLLSFCILWFFINLLVESSVIGLEMVFVHRTYLPTMLFFLMVLVVFGKLPLSIKGYTAILLPLVLIFSFWTFERNKIWQEPIEFWQDAVAKAPEKARPYSNLGKEYAQKKQLNKAEEEFKKAIMLDPNAAIPHHNLGLLYRIKEQYDLAELHLIKATQLKKNYWVAFADLGELYFKKGQKDLALRNYKIAWRFNPDNIFFNKRIGALLVRSPQFHESIPYLEKALSQKNSDSHVLFNLGMAHLKSGNIERGKEYLQNAVRHDENLIQAHYNLGLLYASEGDFDAAQKTFGNALERQEELPSIRYKLANIQLQVGDYTEAGKNYLNLIERGLLLADFYNNLGLVYVNIGSLESAQKMFHRALVINPEHQMAKRNYRLVIEKLEITK